MTELIKKIGREIARLRTWILNLILAAAVILPELMNSPEILGIVPQEYQRWFLAGAFLLNIWARPRRAVLPSDYEAQVSKANR